MRKLTMTTKFRDFLNEQMKDDDFRREYEALELEETELDNKQV